MKTLIVEFMKNQRGPGYIGIFPEDKGPVVFLDRKARHLCGIGIGEFLVEITRTIPTKGDNEMRLCRLIGGFEEVKTLRENRRNQKERLVNELRQIVLNEGISYSESEVDVFGQTYTITLGHVTTRKSRIKGATVHFVDGFVIVGGPGLGSRPDEEGSCRISAVPIKEPLKSEVLSKKRNHPDLHLVTV